MLLRFANLIEHEAKLGWLGEAIEVEHEEEENLFQQSSINLYEVFNFPRLIGYHQELNKSFKCLLMKEFTFLCAICVGQLKFATDQL